MKQKRPRKAYHHGDLRESLVAAATVLIEEAGLGAFTLRECARRAGVSHAAPKNHFATAEDLLAEIAARGFERFVAELAQAADAVPGQADLEKDGLPRAYDLHLNTPTYLHVKGDEKTPDKSRAIPPGEPERAGRWWWEAEAGKECGLHVGADGRLMRKESHAP